MGQRIDQFCEDLRVKLTKIDDALNGLKANIDKKAQRADEEVRDHLADVQKHIDRDRGKVVAAQTDVKNWAAERKIATEDKIAEWRTKRETSRLQKRAEGAERYAAAALDIALAAVDDAEQAALEAWLARQDTDAMSS